MNIFDATFNTFNPFDAFPLKLNVFSNTKLTHYIQFIKPNQVKIPPLVTQLTCSPRILVVEFFKSDKTLIIGHQNQAILAHLKVLLAFT